MDSNNRILSKAQESVWSCSHINCCLHLHMLYIIHIKTSSIQELQESNKYIKSYQQSWKNNISVCIAFEFPV